MDIKKDVFLHKCCREIDVKLLELTNTIKGMLDDAYDHGYKDAEMDHTESLIFEAVNHIVGKIEKKKDECFEGIKLDLERCICRSPDACRDCSYYGSDDLRCIENLMSDALELLKEQKHQIWELQELNEHLQDKAREKSTI